MKQLELSPEALNDLQQTKAYITMEYGGDFAKKIVGNIMDSIGNLLMFPDSGVSIFARYGIACDFMYTLFGIKTTSQETEDYWEK